MASAMWSNVQNPVKNVPKCSRPCGSCPMSQLTLKRGVEVRLKAKIPEIKESDIELLENFRLETYQNLYFTIRDNSSVNPYAVIPSPAVKRKFLISYDKRSKITGYLVFGIHTTKIFVYEIMSQSEEKRRELIMHLIDNYPDMEYNFNFSNSDVLINKMGNLFQSVERINQNLGMYYCSENAKITQIQKTYIPFIDRI